ncbi:cytochrome c oxidase subunit II [Dokdonella immobilis]|uniref:Cytochrome c oxidase subunit 2 n=1 Tax=Dokdonella immobilis TaxID=578942 RepID=A0A1I4WXW1_9GAMM|nr:cytochrome c oxidase subunit II [Dokdonella immobilis]SFN18265.1 cytochrome c oxidase subunit 2 [Dokdonella immobilis]
MRRALAAPALIILGMLASTAASANPQPWQLNMTRGATETSAQVHDIHMIMFWICVVIGVVVFGVMFVAMFRFRKSRGAVAATWSHSTKLEAAWTIIPILILIGSAWPATALLLRMADTSDSEMTIKVTGYQWKWRYEYVDYFGKQPGINFVSSLETQSNRTRQLDSGLDPAAIKVDGVSTYLLDVDKPLVLPAGVKVRFVVTADDVIHAWWVPSLGWKQDAIPGIINSAWTQVDQPGVYRGQCAELCGRDHGFMPIVVKVLPKAEFEQWMTDQAPAPAVEATAITLAPTTAPQG